MPVAILGVPCSHGNEAYTDMLETVRFTSVVLLPIAGWFSLNVPSGLTLYWLVNNIISTGQQVYMKKTIKVELPGVGAVPASQAIIDVEATPIRPKEDRSKKVRDGDGV